jgi:hypothetical protein
MSLEDDERQQLAAALHEARRTIFEREVTPQEFYALLCRYPYLEVRQTGKRLPPLGTTPKIITAKNGWKIYDYGHFLATGCHELMAYLWVLEDSEDGGGEGGDGHGYGTIVQQAADVVEQMLAMAKEKGWTSSDIISGHYPLQRLYWILSDLSGHKVSNFEPSLEDYVVRRWVEALRKKEFVMPRYPQQQRGR